MYMGSHNSLSQVRVFQWPDAATGISSTDVNVRAMDRQAPTRLPARAA